MVEVATGSVVATAVVVGRTIEGAGRTVPGASDVGTTAAEVVGAAVVGATVVGVSSAAADVSSAPDESSPSETAASTELDRVADESSSPEPPHAATNRASSTNHQIFFTRTFTPDSSATDGRRP